VLGSSDCIVRVSPFSFILSLLTGWRPAIIFPPLFSARPSVFIPSSHIKTEVDAHLNFVLYHLRTFFLERTCGFLSSLRTQHKFRIFKVCPPPAEAPVSASPSLIPTLPEEHCACGRGLFSLRGHQVLRSSPTRRSLERGLFGAQEGKNLWPFLVERSMILRVSNRLLPLRPLCSLVVNSRTSPPTI